MALSSLQPQYHVLQWSTIPFSSVSPLPIPSQPWPRYPPPTSLVVEIPETSENPMQSSLFTKGELYGSLLCCVLCAITPNSRTVIQIKNTCASVNSLGGPSREKGGILAPYEDIWGKIDSFELSFFSFSF